MSKKIKFTILILVITSFVAIIGYSIFSYDPITLLFDVKENSTINYNNYLGENSIDFKGENFCYTEKTLFGSTLNIVNKHGSIKKIKGVTSPFQLYENEVFFIKNDTLLSKNINDNTSYVIAEKVIRFTAYNNNIVFLTKGYELYNYNFNSKEKNLLEKDIEQFVVTNNNIFAIDSENWVIKILMSDFSNKKIAKLPIDSYPYKVMAQGDNIIFDLANKIGIFNTENHEIKYIDLFESGYVNNRITYICDRECFYFSLQHTQTDGSIVKDVDHTENGVWQIDLKTFERKKLSSKTFDELYLFDGELFCKRQGTVLCLGAQRK